MLISGIKLSFRVEVQGEFQGGVSGEFQGEFMPAYMNKLHTAKSTSDSCLNNRNQIVFTIFLFIGKPDPSFLLTNPFENFDYVRILYVETCWHKMLVTWKHVGIKCWLCGNMLP